MREKELLYSMLESIAKERNELMQYIMKKIDEMDGIEENIVQHEEIEENLATTITPDIIEDTEDVSAPIETTPVIEEKEEVVVDDIEVIEEIEDIEKVAEEIIDTVEQVVEGLDSLSESDKDEKVVDTVEETESTESTTNVIEEEIVEETKLADQNEVDMVVDDKSEKSMKEIIDEHNKSLGLEDANTAQQGKPIIPKAEIEREKDRLPRRPSSANIDRVNGIIVSTLKRLNKPVHVKEIHTSLNKKLKDNNEGEVNVANLRNNILPRIMKSNKKVQRVTRGYYQYFPK